jgi:hypothetical protein
MAWTPPESDEIVSPAPASGWTPPAHDEAVAPHPAGALGQALYDAISHAVKAASPFNSGPILDTAKAAAAPAAGGLLRMPEQPGASTGEQIARVIGQGLPVAAGTAAAGALAPIVAPAAMAASPLLAGAAATGLGAAAGNTAQQVAAKVSGGQAPDSLGDAAAESAKVGLAAALTDLGIGTAFKGVAAVAPKFVSAFKSFPKEGLKRTLQRPDEILSLAGSQSEAETAAKSALKEVQNGLTLARNQAGKAVENELQAFHEATGGAKIIDGTSAADAGAEALSSRTTSDGVTALTDSEAKKVSAVIQELSDAGPLSAKDAITWRRKLDNLIDYKRGAVPDITSGEGQGIISAMARALRENIGQAAEKAGAYKLAEANANFSKTASAYDAYRPLFNTKTSLGSEAAKRLNAVERLFNAGGISQADLTEIGKTLPGLQKPVDRLIDAVVARRLNMESAGSPSSVTMSAIRFLAGPDGLATALKGVRGVAKSGALRKVAAPVVGTSVALGEQR